MQRQKNKGSGRSTKYSKIKWQILSAIIDLLSLNAAIIVAFFIRFAGKLPAFNFNAYLDLAAYITLIFLVVYYIHDLYDVERYFDWSGTAARILQANFVGMLIVISLSFVLRAFTFPRSVFVISYFTATLLNLLSRFAFTKFFYLELPIERILIVGADGIASKIEKEIVEKKHLGFKLVGTLTISKDENEDKIVDAIHAKVKELNPDRIIFAPVNHSKKFLLELSERLPFNLRLQMVPDIYESIFGRLNFETISDIPLLEIGKPPDTPWTKFGKRAFDILVSSLLLIILLPLFVIVAIAIKLDSKGPLLYKQKRLGYHRTEFWCLKFRTMVVDAEKISGAVLAGENDPRVTRVGKFLRKYRIDELPQLINILKGEMSLV
ncbi:MAG: sugar transferase, partial [Fervidobacterium sp.]